MFMLDVLIIMLASISYLVLEYGIFGRRSQIDLSLLFFDWTIAVQIWGPSLKIPYSLDHDSDTETLFR